MVKLIKNSIPNSLAINGERWTEELLEQYAENNHETSKIKQKYWDRYRQNDVKEALKEECFNKCMYCDTSIGAAEYGHIEHIKPKKINPILTYNWENLGWCCGKCNINKGEFELLNPYETDLEDRLVFTLSNLLSGSSAEDFEAEFFISQLELNNRVELVVKRLQECKKFEDKLNKIKIMYKEKDHNIDMYVLTMKNEFKSNKEYYMFKKIVFNRFIEVNKIQLENIAT